MKMRMKILAALFLFNFMMSCNFNQDKKKTFYNTISGWDIIHVPIIEPYKVSSTDNGVNWLLNKNETGSISVSMFGVSNNFIFGLSANKWFLFDTQSKLFAEYPSKERLFNSLQSLNIPINSIAPCKNYFDTLAMGKNCYWFPKEGQKYLECEGLVPERIDTISVYEKPDNDFDFAIRQKLKTEENGIYFFKIEFGKKNNDLLYFSINNSQPVLISDGLIIPVFINTKEFNVILYTPYPIAQKKGISEEKRIRKTKTIQIYNK